MDYNYFEEIKEDVKEYLKGTSERDFQTLYDEMFINDSITGNASGSYTFNTWQAEENIRQRIEYQRGGNSTLEKSFCVI